MRGGIRLASEQSFCGQVSFLPQASRTQISQDWESSSPSLIIGRKLHKYTQHSTAHTARVTTSHAHRHANSQGGQTKRAFRFENFEASGGNRFGSPSEDVFPQSASRIECLPTRLHTKEQTAHTRRDTNKTYEHKMQEPGETVTVSRWTEETVARGTGNSLLFPIFSLL